VELTVFFLSLLSPFLFYLATVVLCLKFCPSCAICPSSFAVGLPLAGLAPLDLAPSCAPLLLAVPVPPSGILHTCVLLPLSVSSVLSRRPRPSYGRAARARLLCRAHPVCIAASRAGCPRPRPPPSGPFLLAFHILVFRFGEPALRRLCGCRYAVAWCPPAPVRIFGWCSVSGPAVSVSVLLLRQMLSTVLSDCAVVLNVAMRGRSLAGWLLSCESLVVA